MGRILTKQVVAAAVFIFLLATTTYSQQAEVIYKTYCGGCHGARLEGNSATKLIKDTWLHGSTHTAIFKNIKQGIPHTEMKGWGSILNDNQINTLVNYIIAYQNVDLAYRRSQITPGLDNGRNIIQNAFLMDPILNYKNADGTYPVSFSQPGMFANPNYYLVVTQRKNPAKNTTLIANAFAEYKILKDLTYKIS